MIAILNLLLALFLTTLYVLSIDSLSVLAILLIILVFIASFIAVMLVLLLLFGLFLFVFEHTNHRWRWKHFIIQEYATYIFRFIYRVKMNVTGLENLPKDDNFVVYSNHIQATDPIYIYQVYRGHRMAFVAKKSLYKILIFKQLMNTIGCKSIDQFQDRSALKTILETIKEVKSGRAFGIFPEGHRGYSNDMKEFRAGSFKIPLKAKCDISPVVLYDFMEIKNKNRLRGKAQVYLHILPILKYEDIKDMESIELSNLVRKQMIEQSKKFENRK